MDAGKLAVGHRLLVHDDKRLEGDGTGAGSGGGGPGRTVTITQVRNFGGAALMIDLTVAVLHTYYVIAGNQPVLVHNNDGPAAICGRSTAKELRNSPGAASGREGAPVRGNNWLQGSHGNAGRIPGQIADQLRGRSFDSFNELFSSCVAVSFDVVQNEDGLHDRGRSSWAAAQLDQDLPGLEGGDRAFAAGADFRVGAVDGLLPA